MFKVYQPVSRFPHFVEGNEVFPSLVTIFIVGGIQEIIVMLVAMATGFYPEVVIVPVLNCFMNCAVVSVKCFLKKKFIKKKHFYR